MVRNRIDIELQSSTSFAHSFDMFDRSKYFRQTLLFGAFTSVDINSLWNRYCCSILCQSQSISNHFQSISFHNTKDIRGKVKITEQIEDGSISHVGPKIKQ